MMERWITDVLDEVVGQDTDAALRQAVRDLRVLQARGALIALQTRPGKVYSWGAHPNGTTRPGSQESYSALADAAADALHGQELWSGYGVMRRVIPRHAQGRAELIGEPVRGKQGERVSLVVHVRVLSLPGLSQPLVALTPYLRCWETIPASPQEGAVVGYVLDGDAARPARAFVLSAEAWPQGAGGSIELARAYGLHGHADIGLCCGEGARVLVQQRGRAGRLATASKIKQMIGHHRLPHPGRQVGQVLAER